MQNEAILMNEELLRFIRGSASMYHTVSTVSGYLETAGFVRLQEREHWDLREGGRYYVVRNDSSLIAFCTGALTGDLYFRLTAVHTDSPTFSVKEIPELSGPGKYLRLNVEPYGGMINYTWFDRPLGIAGRVMVKVQEENGCGMESRLVYPDRDLVLIPSLSIHLNREINKSASFDYQTDLCPLFSAGKLEAGALDSILAESAGCAPGDITGRNLFLVNRQPGCIWGEEGEFISSPKLDDLQCAFAAMKGFLEALPEQNHAGQLHDCGISVLACFDNEEVGSNTKQGAMSTFLADTLKRVCLCLRSPEEEYYRAIAGSFMISMDNAHALHPNHPEHSDACNTPVLNGGVVIKENAAQKYVTDAFSRGICKQICENAGVPFQTFANKSSIAGGSTLGNLSNTQVSLNAVDVGLAQLAMHSSYETAGTMDTLYAVRMVREYYRTALQIDGRGNVRIRPADCS